MAARVLLSLFLVAALVAAPQVLPTPTAHACSCNSLTLVEQVERAEFIVLGVVTRIEQVGDPDAPVFPPEYDIDVAVDEYLKGSGPDSVVVQNFSLDSDGCSAFERDSVGQEHLLFLSRFEDRLRTGTCEGSGRVTDHPSWSESIEEVRRIVSRQVEPTATEQATSITTPAATETPVATDLPETGSGDGTDGTLVAVSAIAAAVLGLGALGVAGWRGLRRV